MYFIYRNEQHKFNERTVGFVNISAWSNTSQLCVFARFESFYLPRIWKVSNLAFIFNILLSFMLNKIMVTIACEQLELTSGRSQANRYGS